MGQMFGQRASRADCSPTDSGFWQRIVVLVFDPVLMRDRLSPVWTNLPQKRLGDAEDWNWKRIFGVLCRIVETQHYKRNKELFGDEETTRSEQGLHGIGPGDDLDALCIRVANIDPRTWANSLVSRLHSSTPATLEYVDSVVHDALSVLVFFGANIKRLVDAREDMHELIIPYNTGAIWNLSVFAAACKHRYVHVVKLVLSQPGMLYNIDDLDYAWANSHGGNTFFGQHPFWLAIGHDDGSSCTTDAAVRIVKILEIMREPRNDPYPTWFLSLNKHSRTWNALAALCTQRFARDCDRLGCMQYMINTLEYSPTVVADPWHTRLGSISQESIERFGGPSCFHSILQAGCDDGKHMDPPSAPTVGSLHFLLHVTNTDMSKYATQEQHEFGLHWLAWFTNHVEAFTGNPVNHVMAHYTNRRPATRIPFVYIFQAAPAVQPAYVKAVIEFYNTLNADRERSGYDKAEFLNWHAGDGITPLFIAIERNNHAVLETLVEAGASLTALKMFDYNLLHEVVQRNQHVIFGELLRLNHKYNNNQSTWLYQKLRTHEEWTPLRLIKHARNKAEFDESLRQFYGLDSQGLMAQSES